MNIMKFYLKFSLKQKSKTYLKRFNKSKDKKEKWMTDELLTQINKKNDMYVDWKTNSRSIDIYNNNKLILKRMRE